MRGPKRRVLSLVYSLACHATHGQPVSYSKVRLWCTCYDKTPDEFLFFFLSLFFARLALFFCFFFRGSLSELTSRGMSITCFASATLLLLLPPPPAAEVEFASMVGNILSALPCILREEKKKQETKLICLKIRPMNATVQQVAIYYFSCLPP